MASQVCETNLAFINGALLMSLMEEPSPISDESDDDDRLDTLIRSFEAEISGSNNKMGDHHHQYDSSISSIGSEILMSNNINMEECATQSWNNNNIGEIDNINGVECCWGNSSSSSSSEFGVEWVDMDFVPSSPFDPCGDEYAMENNNFKLGLDGFALGEHGYNSSLWQDMACN